MKKILIVDDAEGIRLLLVNIISKWDCFDVAQASTVKAATTLCSVNKYELIFLDHRLRDGLGWELAELISMDPARFGKPRIIAMSGSIFPGTDDKGKKFYSEFLRKPFEISTIGRILEEVSGQSSSGK